MTEDIIPLRIPPIKTQDPKVLAIQLEEILGKMRSDIYYLSPAGGGSDHSTLTNLDYASANHTGFEPTVTKGNLTATSPLTFNNTRQVIGGAAAISIPAATTNTSGYLTDTDWDTFNEKSRIRKAFASVAAGAATTIACYLDTDGVGDTVTVNCSVIGAANLNSAVPRLEDGSLIFVTQISSDWWCVSPFIKSKVC